VCDYAETAVPEGPGIVVFNPEYGMRMGDAKKLEPLYEGMGDFMKQAQEMQERMQAVQQEIAALEVHGESGAGLVRVVMNGRHEVKRVTIDPSLMGEPKDVLEDLVAAACNDAVHKAEAVQQEKMSGMAAGLGLPLDKLGF
jgi:DNA-binding YbaB/EbfC family protein